MYLPASPPPKTAFWKRSRLLIKLLSQSMFVRSDSEIDGPDVAPRDPIWRAIRQPLARSCRRYFRIAAFRDAAPDNRGYPAKLELPPRFSSSPYLLPFASACLKGFALT